MLLNDYIRQKHAVYTFDNRNESDIVVEFFMTALRDLRGFTAVEFRAVTGFELTSELFRKIESLLHRGLISENNGKYFLTRMGLFSANSVIYELTEDYIR
jgi:coproporphyrinogen III oxidase-like Fe-S oxidoreductase